MACHINNNVKVFTAVLVVLCVSRIGDACFPSKYWISCLIDTCKLGGKCPGDPAAECKMEKTKCNGCKPTWYTKTGEKANCSVRKNLKLCPGGEPIVHCKVDSCKWPCAHPDFKGAACRQGYCGECKAEYFLKDSWVNCPVSTTGAKGEMLPIDTVLSDSCIKVNCAIDICINKRCSKVPRAVCRPDICNECRPAWFLDNIPVDCNTGEFITNKPGFEPLVSPSKALPPWQRECAQDVPLVPCGMKACENKICRNFPNAQCRPDGCGECKDTWYVDNKLVDCLSDACPPNVPIVKCVDDPCKYFGHYCPAAECRASQCGKCEAKFFANGQEIDCAMPPKECPASVQPLNCPWYTCPANICPSNRRLMCRINPCGRKCNYEFIDIYNGEPLLCRVFEGDGRHKDNTQSDITADLGQIPFLGDLVPSGTSRLDSKPIQISDNSGSSFLGKVSLNPARVSTAVGNGAFVAEPFFINPGPPITDPDLLSLLRAFPHEMANIPSAMIQSALKKNRGISGISVAPNIPESLDIGAVLTPVADASVPVFAVERPAVQTGALFNQNTIAEQSMKKAFSTSDIVLDNQLLDLATKDSALYPELSSVPLAPVGPDMSASRFVDQPPMLEKKLDKPKPQPKNFAPKSIAAGKPAQKKSEMLGSRLSNTKTENSKHKKASTKKQTPKKQSLGVPISLGLFSQWSLG